MRRLTILAAMVVAAPLTAVSAPSLAATAHNSQAGAWGPNKDICGPTPYFRNGGCLMSYFRGADDGEVLPSGGRYRARPRLRSLDR